MESGKTYSLVVANNVVSSIENIEEIPAPDGGIVKLLSLCPVVRKVNDDNTTKYTLGSKIIKTRIENVASAFPLLEDIEVSLSKDSDPKKFLSLPAYVSTDKTIGNLVDLSSLSMGTVKLLFKKYVGGGCWARELREHPVKTVFPLIDNSVVFVGRIQDYGIKLSNSVNLYTTSSEIFLCTNTLQANRREFVVPVKSGQGRVYDVKESDVVIPDFLLKKRSKEDKIDETPILLLSSKNTDLAIYQPSSEDKEEITVSFELENLVSVVLEGTSFLGKVVEMPSAENYMYAGVKFFSPRVQDEITLLNGKQGLYVQPQNVTPVGLQCVAYAGSPISIKDFDFNGVNLSGERGRILLEPNAASEDILVEFKKDVGGSSADGMGSPGRCVHVPIESIRYVSSPGINVSSYFYNGKYIAITPDAQEVLDKIPREVIGELQKFYNATGKVGNIAGTLVNIRDRDFVLSDTNCLDVLLCGNTLVPAECVVSLKREPPSVFKILKTKDLTKSSYKEVNDILNTVPNLTDEQIITLSRLRDSLRRKERTADILPPRSARVVQGALEEEADIEDDNNELEEYAADYDEELDEEIEEEHGE